MRARTLSIVAGLVGLLVCILALARPGKEQAFDFPGTPAGQFAAEWFSAINGGDQAGISTYLSDASSRTMFDAMSILGQKVKGIQPRLMSYETEGTISIYSQDGLGGWVKVKLDLDDEGRARAMSVKKAFEPVAYPLQNGMTLLDVSKVVNGVADAIESSYIKPASGAAYAKELRMRLADGNYRQITQGDLLAEFLTADLRDMSNDKHLQVIPPGLLSEVQERFGPSQKAADYPTYSAPKSGAGSHGKPPEQRRANFASSLLSENIGLLSIERFVFDASELDALHNAMEALKNCSAIVIDLRSSAGGDAEAVTSLLSYFFDHAVQVSGSLASNSLNIQSTAPNELSGRLAQTPLAILIGKNTISAAEAFAYVMKRTSRATIVGEQTAGGGNHADVFPVVAGFFLVSSVSTSFDSGKGEGWEGKGIIPDVAADERDALETALSIMKERENSGHSPVKVPLAKTR